MAWLPSDPHVSTAEANVQPENEQRKNLSIDQYKINGLNAKELSKDKTKTKFLSVISAKKIEDKEAHERSHRTHDFR